MTQIELFTIALNLESPWSIKSIRFEPTAIGSYDLHIDIVHQRGVRFEYEGNEYPVYDHQERTWKHLRFFQHECYLHARVPRVKTDDGKYRLISVPWAQTGSSFTLLMEKDVLSLIRAGLSATQAGKRFSITGKRVFGIVRRHVSSALSEQPLDNVKALSVDETSRCKGHNYLTIMCDREAKKVVGIAPGKDKEAFAHALIDMEVRGADRTKVKSVTMDMSKSYIAGVEENLAQVDIVFDRFHIVKKMNEAVDAIRRADQNEFKALKNSRYLWLKNHSSLGKAQQERVNQLAMAYPNIGTAYRLKELLKVVLDDARYNKRLTPINDWIKEAWNSEIKEVQDFVNMLHRHWYGIKTYFKKVADNAYAERVNLKIQEIKRTAKGYRNIQNFILMIYFHLGGLDFKIH